MPTAVLELLRESFRRARVLRVDSYEYIVHPLLDGVPPVDPELLEEAVNALFEIGDMDCDLIVAPEAMGLPLAAVLSLMSDIPYVAIRKRQYGLEGEIRMDRSTGYSDGAMYLNGVGEGDRVTVVDDVLSTGGTLREVIRALREAGADVVEVLVVADKGGLSDELERELAVRIKSLVRIEIRDGQVHVR